MTTISIIMPAYNSAETIDEAIQSICTQTYIDWELWVIDDGSTDTTAEVVQSFDDARIHYVWQSNQERSAARNAGLRLAQGTYLTFLDSDDFWEPTYLATHINYLTAHPEIDITTNWAYETDAAGQVVRMVRPGFTEALSCEAAWRKLLYGNRFLMGAIVLRRHIATIDFDTRLQQAEDWDYWLRLVRHHRVHTIQKPLSYYRRYGVYMPTRRLKRNSEEMLVYILEKALADSPQAVRDAAVGHAYWELAWLSYATERIEQGQMYMMLAYQLAPHYFDREDAIVERIAYFADELYDLHTPMSVALAHIGRFFENLPSWAASVRGLQSATEGFYASLALFRASEQADRQGVRQAGNLILRRQPSLFRNRGLAKLYLSSFAGGRFE